MSNNKYKKILKISDRQYSYFDIVEAAKDCKVDIKKIPYSLRVLFENCVRHNKDSKILSSFADWKESAKNALSEIDFLPARVLMQDFTGVPAIVDLAAMRDAVKKRGGDPLKINPMIPVDLVIDHSVQVDYFASNDAYQKNTALEVERNRERYEFLKWGQQSFSNFRVVPPGTGICHQVNLEYLAQVVFVAGEAEESLIYPDTLVGTDSHTTMVNGLAVLGWGVGGIEAEAAMLGQPIPMLLPEVIGVHLKGKMQGMATATDLVLAVTNMLRKKGVVGKFVEFFGEGLKELSLADRATISNMSPEYGATCGFFPIDQETLNYLHLTGRNVEHIELVKAYAKKQHLWYDNEHTPEYSDILELDLKALVPSVAGPRRPQDKLVLNDVGNNFRTELPSLIIKGDSIQVPRIEEKFQVSNQDYKIGHGDLVIAAITSCTNTSNPTVMIGAGLLAKKAVALGMKVKPWVKTSLAPGSQVVSAYLQATDLQQYLDQLGFNVVGYGCTTCIGNSGPLQKEIEEVIAKNKLVVAAVLSGNRNFEGRIQPFVRANYLASPILVVAYALAGTINLDLTKDAIGQDKNGKAVYLYDLWPDNDEINALIKEVITPQMFIEKYRTVFDGNIDWQNLTVVKSSTYRWQKDSTYIKNPPYFKDNDIEDESRQSDISETKTSKRQVGGIINAQILAVLGDSITTDHISPAGNISKNSPAGQYLIAQGVEPKDFNSYGARRGNHEVMMRGTFANVRIKNALCPSGIEGGYSLDYNNKETSMYDAAMSYQKHNVPLIIYAGKEYGSGSSRDWAAKGTKLLGVRAIIAESFERIHRSNLIGMGVLPFKIYGDDSLRRILKPGKYESLDIIDINPIKPLKRATLALYHVASMVTVVEVELQVFTDQEIEYLLDGGIMHTVLKKFV